MSEQNTGTKKKYGWKGFIPLLVFLGFYLGAGIIFTFLGYAGDAFKQIPRITALVAALVAVMCMGGKERSLEYRMDVFCKGMANQGTMIMVVVFLLAGAFSGVCKAMGGVQATANLGLSLVPSRFLFAGLFLISAFMGTAMGTSMGTISAIGPIAVAVAESAGLNMAFAIASVLGGAMFGDNLSMISDTTIAATRGAGCEMREKFQMNGLIALIAAILAMILFTIVGGGGAQLEGEFTYDIIKVIPYIFVLVFALTGINVFVLLLAGIGIAGIIGFISGDFTLPTFAQAISSGMSGMYDISLVALLLRGVGGTAEDLGAIEWLENKMMGSVSNRRGAEYTTAAMVSIFDLAIANNTIAILMAAPLTRDMAAKYNIAPKRIASLLDIFACVLQGIVPHGGQILLCITLTGLNPFAVIGANFYCYILAIVTLVTIQFGLLKTKEEKEGIPMYDENGEVLAMKAE